MHIKLFEIVIYVYMANSTIEVNVNLQGGGEERRMSTPKRACSQARGGTY